LLFGAVFLVGGRRRRRPCVASIGGEGSWEGESVVSLLGDDDDDHMALEKEGTGHFLSPLKKLVIGTGGCDTNTGFG